MQPRERLNDQTEATLAALEGLQSELWTALPAIVRGFDIAKMTAELQPTIQARVLSRDGKAPLPGAVPDDVFPYWRVTMPPLLDVPVVFPSGGGLILTFPIKVGDEVLVVFSARCIDSWWQQGGVQPQADFRMHDLSDGFAIPGPRSLPNTVTGISASAAQLRTDDGTVFVEVGPGGIKLNGPVEITGDVALTGKLTATGEIKSGTHTLTLHTHGGVASGSGTTNPPTG